MLIPEKLPRRLDSDKSAVLLVISTIHIIHSLFFSSNPSQFQLVFHQLSNPLRIDSWRNFVETSHLHSEFFLALLKSLEKSGKLIRNMRLGNEPNKPEEPSSGSKMIIEGEKDASRKEIRQRSKDISLLIIDSLLQKHKAPILAAPLRNYLSKSSGKWGFHIRAAGSLLFIRYSKDIEFQKDILSLLSNPSSKPSRRDAIGISEMNWRVQWLLERPCSSSGSFFGKVRKEFEGMLENNIEKIEDEGKKMFYKLILLEQLIRVNKFEWHVTIKDLSKDWVTGAPSRIQPFILAQKKLVTEILETLGPLVPSGTPRDWLPNENKGNLIEIPKYFQKKSSHLRQFTTVLGSVFSENRSWSLLASDPPLRFLGVLLTLNQNCSKKALIDLLPYWRELLQSLHERNHPDLEKIQRFLIKSLSAFYEKNSNEEMGSAPPGLVDIQVPFVSESLKSSLSESNKEQIDITMLYLKLFTFTPVSMPQALSKISMKIPGKTTLTYFSLQKASLLLSAVSKDSKSFSEMALHVKDMQHLAFGLLQMVGFFANKKDPEAEKSHHEKPSDRFARDYSAVSAPNDPGFSLFTSPSDPFCSARLVTPYFVGKALASFRKYAHRVCSFSFTKQLSDYLKILGMVSLEPGLLLRNLTFLVKNKYLKNLDEEVQEAQEIMETIFPKSKRKEEQTRNMRRKSCFKVEVANCKGNFANYFKTKIEEFRSASNSENSESGPSEKAMEVWYYVLLANAISKGEKMCSIFLNPFFYRFNIGKNSRDQKSTVCQRKLKLLFQIQGLSDLLTKKKEEKPSFKIQSSRLPTKDLSVSSISWAYSLFFYLLHTKIWTSLSKTKSDSRKKEDLVLMVKLCQFIKVLLTSGLVPFNHFPQLLSAHHALKAHLHESKANQPLINPVPPQINNMETPSPWRPDGYSFMDPTNSIGFLNTNNEVQTPWKNQASHSSTILENSSCYEDDSPFKTNQFNKAAMHGASPFIYQCKSASFSLQTPKPQEKSQSQKPWLEKEEETLFQDHFDLFQFNDDSVLSDHLSAFLMAASTNPSFHYNLLVGQVPESILNQDKFFFALSEFEKAQIDSIVASFDADLLTFPQKPVYDKRDVAFVRLIPEINSISSIFIGRISFRNPELSVLEPLSKKLIPPFESNISRLFSTIENLEQIIKLNSSGVPIIAKTWWDDLLSRENIIKNAVNEILESLDSRWTKMFFKMENCNSLEHWVDLCLVEIQREMKKGFEKLMKGHWGEREQVAWEKYQKFVKEEVMFECLGWKRPENTGFHINIIHQDGLASAMGVLGGLMGESIRTLLEQLARGTISRKKDVILKPVTFQLLSI